MEWAELFRETTDGPLPCRKKPVVINAMRYTRETREGVVAWLRREGVLFEERRACWHDGDCLILPTLEGRLQANDGDVIIQGVKGEFYPCRFDIFVATYDAL